MNAADPAFIENRLPPWQTMGAMLADAGRLYGAAPYVIDGETVKGFAEIRTHSRRLARALLAAGVGKGDLVLVWAPNSWRFVVLAHAVWAIGAVVVPISSRLKLLEAGPILERTGARILFTVAECAGTRFIDRLREAYGDAGPGRPFAKLPALRRLVRLDADHTDDPAEGVGFEAFCASGESVELRQLDAAEAQVGADDICEVIFTSGTTGAPKGVQLAHRQLIRSYWDWSGIGGLQPGDRYLVITPFSHGFGLNAGVIASALRGVAIVLLDIFEPKAAIRLIDRHGVAIMGGPPNLFTRLMDDPDLGRYRTRSLRVAFVGAASVPVEILKRIGAVLGIARVCNAYGLMEACVVSMTRADDAADVIATSAGRPLPDVEVRIVDAEDRDLPAGETGEILVRSYGVMQGYWRDPEQTAASLAPGGWFRTSDIGSRDVAGNIRIVDRKKDMFICGGFNAYPAEIENLLLRMGPVSTVSVVGIPHPASGEACVAFLVPAAGASLDEQSVIAWARANMASYKVPRRVFIRSALPLNPNGKVMKDVLKQEAIESFAN